MRLIRSVLAITVGAGSSLRLYDPALDLPANHTTTSAARTPTCRAKVPSSSPTCRRASRPAWWRGYSGLVLALPIVMRRSGQPSPWPCTSRDSCTPSPLVLLGRASSVARRVGPRLLPKGLQWLISRSGTGDPTGVHLTLRSAFSHTFWSCFRLRRRLVPWCLGVPRGRSSDHLQATLIVGGDRCQIRGRLRRLSSRPGGDLFSNVALLPRPCTCSTSFPSSSDDHPASPPRSEKRRD